MATTTIDNTTVVFSNSGAAANITDSTLSEDSASLALTFDVLALSGGGTKTTLYSVDDGTKGDDNPVVTVSSAFSSYDTDLLYKDATVVSWQLGGDTSAKGAHVWIGTDGKVHYDANNLYSTLQALAAGATFTDTFEYTIRMSNGTLSVGTITVNIAGWNDAPALDLDGNDSSTATGANFATTFTENGSAVAIADTDVSITDVDSTNMQSAAITLTNAQANDSLAVNGILPLGITASINTSVPGQITVTLSGSATLGTYQTALHQIVFSNSSDSPSTIDRNITVVVSDGSANSNTAISTIHVTAVNDAPAGTDNTVTTLEDTAKVFTAADFGFTDPNDSPANALAAVKITTLPGAGSLTDNGIAVTTGQLVSVADINAGLLVFTPAANANGTGYASFTFQVQDDGGTANGGVNLDQSANTLTINVTAVNDAPAGTDNTVTTLEDTTKVFTAADFGFTDPNDSPANALAAVKITTLPGAGSLTDNGIAVTTGQLVSVADINAGLLVFTPAANANGTGYASFTFQVQDDGGTANGGVNLDQSANTLTIDVTAVNDAPAGTDNTVTTLEDTTKVFTAADFGFTDPNDSPANALAAVKITTLPGAGSLTDNGIAVTTGQLVSVADINAGLLVFTPAANANGTGYASFTFQVQDDGGTANGGVNLDQSANTLTIDVTAVNDAPAGTDNTVTTLEDTTKVFTAADFGFTDPNDSPANALAAVKITTLPGAGSLTDNGIAVTTGQLVSVADINAGLLVFTPAANANGTGYASFTFQVQDDGGTANGGVNLDQSANTLTIDVTAVNDAPAGTDNTVTTLEDTTKVFTAADFGFTDPNDSPANALAAVKITTLPGAGSLTDNGIAVTTGQLVSVADINAGLLVFTPAANANGTGYASFTFQVQDDGGTANGGVNLDQSANTLTIDVTAVNDAPAGTDNTVTTLEDTTKVFTAADFGFTDPNDSPANALAAVKITTLPGAGSLTDNGIAVTTGQLVSVADINAGLLVFTPAANANGTGYASFTFQVQDDGGTANGGVNLDQSANTLTIDVTAVNDAPAGTDNTVTTLEDTAKVFTAADFGFTDPNDSPANALAAVKITTLPGAGSLTDNGIAVTTGQLVSVADINAGLLVFTPAANANGTGYASFTFQVQDDGGTANGGVNLDQSANTLTIDVTAVNDAPAGTDNTVTTLEDTTKVFTAADFGFTDPNDSPANALAAVKITTLPGAGSLTDNGIAVTTGQLVSVADINAGLLVFTPAANANGTGYASFTFQVQDDGGTANGGVNLDQSANTLTIDVTAVNDAPAGTDNTVTTLEDTTKVFTAADFGFTDPNDSPANALAAVKITTLPGAGSLTDNGIAVTTGQLVSVADINAGLLVFTPAANANGTGYASFTFQVQDDGGTANGGVNLDQSANTLTIDVTAVNDAPAGTDNTVTTLEDTTKVFTAADFGFTDPNDSPANALAAVKITTLPGAGSLTDNGIAVTTGQLVSVADINAGLLVFTPAANANGTGYASFTFQVQDDGGTANGGVNLDQSANTLTINVTAVNDAPAGTDNTVTTLEDTAKVFTAADFGFTDPNDSPANALAAVKITTLPGAGSLTDNGIAVTTGQLVSVADINAGLLVFTPAANANGTGYASFTFQVQDDGGTANGGVNLDQSANTLTIDVTAVNDAPAGTDNTVTTLEDTTKVFTAADFGFTDPNDSPANALAAVKITTLPGAGSLTDNGIAVTTGQLVSVADINAGLLVFTPAANANGTGYASFTFQVQDDGGTANGGVNLDQSANTLTIDVTAVNDAPAGTDNTVTTLEDTAKVFTAADFGFTDPNDSPANALAAVKITTLPGAGSLTDNGIAVTTGQLVSVADINAGLLVFTPAANANGTGYASFTFQVQDDGGTANGGVNLDQSANTLTINVTAVNDAPTTTADNVRTNVGTNAAVVIPDWALLANDTDPDSPTLSVTNISNVTGASGSGATHAGGNVTFNDNVTLSGSFDYQASDGSLSGAAATVTITNNANTNNATINGTAGNDILIGGGNATNVTLSGGLGNDIIISASNNKNTSIGGDGNDTILLAFGGNGANSTTITGDALAAQSGTDSDTLVIINQTGTGTSVDLSVTGTNNEDLTSTDNAVVTGFENVDASRASLSVTLTGSISANTLIGGAGADAIKGLGGADKLTGGASADTFKYTAVADSNHSAFDTITDFTSGSDKVQFIAGSGITISQGALGSAAGSVSASSVAWFVDTANNQTIVYGNSTGGALNGGNANLVEIHLAGAPSLVGTDFVFGGAPAGVAGEPVNLALTDPPDHVGAVTLTIAGVPSGWMLNEGIANGDGSWTVQTDNPSALTITAPSTFSGALTLNVMEQWTHADGSTGGAIVRDNVEVYAPVSPIFAWSGDDTLTGSSGHDMFVFSQPIGHDAVYGFNAAADQIDLIGYAGFTSFGDVQAHTADDASGNAVITLGDGQSIELYGVNTASLTAGDFAFDLTPVTHNAGDMTISDGAMLPLSGTVDNTGTIELNASGSETELQLIQHGITLEGGGQVILSDSSENMIIGTASDVTLDNVDNIISGAGQLGAGQMTLINEGTIIANGTNQLVINTGANVVSNLGTLEATGSGGLVIESGVENFGTLWANGGNIAIGGAVTGNGNAVINGAATLEFGAASSANTTFAADASGTLQLDDSFDFSGAVSGFDGNDRLDLADIQFNGQVQMNYTANAEGTGGTLSVSDGTHTANITLLGQFTTDGFQTSDDQHLGTLITYHPPSV